ncbi:hypothetical protein [Shewanella sp. YIC-542]|uniref:hypothetical protein n=1 Tax=Shewanella mytili TaxID=3377111 RepID=UPI00398E9C30
MRYFLIAAFTSLLSYHAYGSVESQLAHCAAISDDAARLACYDTLAGGGLAATPVATPAPAVPAMPSQAMQPQAAPQPSPTDKFGIKQQVVEPELDTIKAQVTHVGKTARGSLIVTLDNGQTWQQIGAESYRLKAKQSVVIKRAAFDSFLLSVDGMNRTIRVKRQQ